MACLQREIFESGITIMKLRLYRLLPAKKREKLISGLLNIIKLKYGCWQYFVQPGCAAS
jgi:hypothetical protein